MTTSYKASTETVGRFISNTVRNVVRTSIYFGALLLGAGCASPTAPSVEPPPKLDPVLFRVDVVNGSFQPQPGRSVRLILNGGSVMDETPLTQIANAEGIVTWHVQPGPAYAVCIERFTFFGKTVVVGDVRWYAQLPWLEVVKPINPC